MNMLIMIENENTKINVRRQTARVATETSEKRADDRVGKEADIQEQTGFSNNLEEAEVWLNE